MTWKTVACHIRRFLCPRCPLDCPPDIAADAHFRRCLAESRTAVSKILNRGIWAEEATLFQRLIDLVEILADKRR